MAGAGYINFHVNFAKFSALTLESVKQLKFDYGFVKTAEPTKLSWSTQALIRFIPSILGKPETLC